MPPCELIIQAERAGDYAAALQLARECEAIDEEQVRALIYKHFSLGFAYLVFDEKEEPRESLLKILTASPLRPSEGKLFQINRFAQANFLRQGERWNQQSEEFESLKSQVLPWFTELGFVCERNPLFKVYRGVVVHGAALPTVERRIQFLVKQWKKGIQFENIYFLTSSRPLTDSERARLPTTEPKTEAQMMLYLWLQTEMHEAVPLFCIDVPMKTDGEGKPVRPTTDDTVAAWVQMNPTPGNYLLISSAPFINRQDLIMRTSQTKAFGFDTVGPELLESERVAILADELARFIFQRMKWITEQQ
jgi:hypothetical protein